MFKLLFVVVQVIFLIFKLSGAETVADWSWWMVFAPGICLVIYECIILTIKLFAREESKYPGDAATAFFMAYNVAVSTREKPSDVIPPKHPKDE